MLGDERALQCFLREVYAHSVGQQRALVRLREACEGLKSSLEAAVAQVELLSAPPRSVARLHHVDLERALAMVEVNRGMPIQVRVDLEQIEDPETLEAGRDVLLTHNQTAIVGALDAGRTLGGALRVISFERWLDDGPLGPLSGRRCVATERGEEILAWAPQGIADELRALVDGGAGRPRLLVDGFDQVVACEANVQADPRVAAARFRVELEPVPPEGVVGREQARAAIERVVLRVSELGAFVLCEGDTGTGKTHLARYALHLLRGQGETAVLRLGARFEHRYYGQEEADVEEMFRVARALAEGGTRVMLHLDECDRHFYSSRWGSTEHRNSTRATLLEELGGPGDLRGILVWATTNKADRLPDEVLNRVSQVIHFEPLTPPEARGILDLELPDDVKCEGGREGLLDAVVDAAFDDGEATLVARARLRDHAVLEVRRRHLRQLSARFFAELARRLAEDGRAPGNGRRVRLSLERALERVDERVWELVAGTLTAENLAQRTFLSISPRNPVVEVDLIPAAAARPRWLRYAPLEIPDDE